MKAVETLFDCYRADGNFSVAGPCGRTPGFCCWIEGILCPGTWDLWGLTHSCICFLTLTLSSKFSNELHLSETLPEAEERPDYLGKPSNLEYPKEVLERLKRKLPSLLSVAKLN